MMRQWQLPSQIYSAEPVSMPMDSLQDNAPFQSLFSPPSCVTVLFVKNDQAIKEQCSLVISHMPCTYIPIAVGSSLWIIPSNPQT